MKSPARRCTSQLATAASVSGSWDGLDYLDRSQSWWNRLSSRLQWQRFVEHENLLQVPILGSSPRLWRLPLGRIHALQMMSHSRRMSGGLTQVRLDCQRRR